ncbi:MAG TPA: glycosyltransferase family 4 protein [Chitinophagaceae bacterium]|nr:glycosyltransferase family 4 protein [Chitinophagaceae bacterium]
MTYRAAVLKRNVELVIMAPFVLLGKLAGHIYPLKQHRSVFLFFPSSDIGGSVKVNADIVECIKDQKPVIVFSKNPGNNQFRDLFKKEDVLIIDLHKYIDNKLYHFINFFFRGMLSTWINKAKRPVMFGGESLFFYKVIPHVKKETKIIELCHLNTWINFTQAFAKYIDLRIFSTPKIKRDVENQYQRNHLPQSFFDKLVFIDNKVDIPVYEEITNNILQVVYIGRGAPQKRVHLITEMARRMHESGIAAHFSFVGDVEKIIPGEIKKYVTLYGQVKGEKELHDIYMRSDVLILASAYEGLPIVIMDMMARGKVIISTAVDGIPDYITHGDNGLLITEKEEGKIVDQGIELLNLLITDPALKKEIGRRSYDYALKHFSGETFCQTYRKILVGQ